MNKEYISSPEKELVFSDVQTRMVHCYHPFSQKPWIISQEYFARRWDRELEIASLLIQEGFPSHESI